MQFPSLSFGQGQAPCLSPLLCTAQGEQLAGLMLQALSQHPGTAQQLRDTAQHHPELCSPFIPWLCPGCSDSEGKGKNGSVFFSLALWSQPPPALCQPPPPPQGEFSPCCQLPSLLTAPLVSAFPVPAHFSPGAARYNLTQFLFLPMPDAQQDLSTQSGSSRDKSSNEIKVWCQLCTPVDSNSW